MSPSQPYNFSAKPSTGRHTAQNMEIQECTWTNIHKCKHTNICAKKCKPISHLIFHSIFFWPATTSTATGKDRLSFEIKLLKSSLMTCILQSVIVLDLDLETWNERGCIIYLKRVFILSRGLWSFIFYRCQGVVPSNTLASWHISPLLYHLAVLYIWVRVVWMH